MSDLDDLEAKARAATPMPDREKRWFADGDSVFWQAMFDGQPTTVPQTFIRVDIGVSRLEYIAAASPDVILVLIARVRRAEAALREALDLAELSPKAWNNDVHPARIAELRKLQGDHE